MDANVLIGPPIETEDQVRAWILKLVEQIERERVMADMALVVQVANTAYRRWMINYGFGLGALVALKRCGKLSDVAYNELNQRIVRTTVPTVSEAPPV
jgi:hypothetical protein